MRRRRTWLGAAAVVVVVAVAASLWFEPWRLLTHSYADEALPVALATEVVTTAPVTPGPTTPATTAATPRTTPPAADVLVSRTAFVSAEHETTGEVLLIRLADGSHLVRLMGFKTSDGPDLHVVLGTSDAGDIDVGDPLELGPLRATSGNLNYAVPAGTDVSTFRNIAIWCQRFDAVFGSAPLGQA